MIAPGCITFFRSRTTVDDCAAVESDFHDAGADDATHDGTHHRGSNSTSDTLAHGFPYISTNPFADADSDFYDGAGHSGSRYSGADVPIRSCWQWGRVRFVAPG